MATITIELEDTESEILNNEARELGLSVSQLASTIVGSHTRMTKGKPLDAAFQKSMTDTFRDHAEVYRRLAQ